jgi:hypothetical protein
VLAGGSSALVALMLLLTGCTSNPVQAGADPDAQSSASAGSGSSSGNGSGPAATSTPTQPVGIPVTLGCDQIVPPEEMTRFDAALAPESGYSPAAGSAAATVVSLQGVACAWGARGGADRVEVAVAQMSPADIEARKNAMVSESKQVPTFNAASDEGYFRVDGSTGRADAFVGDYWIVASSPLFYEPGDAQSIIETAAASLR